MRATIFPLRSFGPSTWTSLAGKPASSKRLAIAFAAIVVLPTESVVLISTSCLKMSRASCLVLSFTWARSAVAEKKPAVIASAYEIREFNLFSPRKGTNEPSRHESPGSKRRRGEGLVLRRFQNGDGEAVKLQLGDVVHRAGVENLAEGSVNDVCLIFRQQSQKFSETIFGLGIFGGLLGSQRAVARYSLFVALVELIAKLLLVKRGIRGFLRTGRFTRYSQSFRGEIIQCFLKIAEVSRRAHQRPPPALAQRRRQLIRARFEAFSIGSNGSNGPLRRRTAWISGFLGEVRYPRRRSHLQNLRAAKSQAVGSGSFRWRWLGFLERRGRQQHRDQQRGK